ncbi:MAG: hypothetical protein HYZ50_07965 [Deltaproteobacteria bacterium]|nr:hypothetical protein [Deltaproteobacteria bacterium]
MKKCSSLFGSLDFAPEGFGPYAGQLFVVDVGHYEIPVPLGQALRADGKVYRVTLEGKLELVASGFINPWDCVSLVIRYGSAISMGTLFTASANCRMDLLSKSHREGEKR